MSILLIDNYDSFTYNLFQYIGESTGEEPIVFYNNEINIKLIKQIKPSQIFISPGPGNPAKKRDRGNCTAIIRHYYNKLPILGICMGHQILAYTFHGKILNHNEIYHGKTSEIILKSNPIFKNIPDKIIGMRYHSLIVEKNTLPDHFRIIAELQDKTIMGIQLKNYPVYGLQFHPESIGTGYGKKIIQNFLTISKGLINNELC